VNPTGPSLTNRMKRVPSHPPVRAVGRSPCAIRCWQDAGVAYQRRDRPPKCVTGEARPTARDLKVCYAESVTYAFMRVAIVVLTILIIDCSCERRSTSSFELPGVMLWAWQRAENLTFIDTRSTGVAYLAGTVRILPNGFPQFEPRLQPLGLRPGTPVLAVVRIESTGSHSRAQIEPLLQALQQIAHQPAIRGLQIDFDALVSERPFYVSLLHALTIQSPVPVGVTALASWCEGERWLEGTDIAEAVPMFFRMGRGEAHNMQVTSKLCESSIGLSTDESWPLHRPPGVHRIYVFSPRAWDRDMYANALQRIDNWK
jgi:hypothetical protein